MLVPMKLVHKILCFDAKNWIAVNFGMFVGAQIVNRLTARHASPLPLGHEQFGIGMRNWNTDSVACVRIPHAICPSRHWTGVHRGRS